MIRAIHPFGPPVGAYVPSGSTDIRLTLERARRALAEQPPADTAVIDVHEIETIEATPVPDDLPRTNAFLGVGIGGAVFA